MDSYVLALGVITLGAAIVNGALGYGFSSITVPLALLFLANRVLNPALVLIEVALNTYVLWVNRASLPKVWRRMLPIVIGLVPGVAIGTALVSQVNPGWLKFATFVALLPLIEQPEAIGNAFAIARATPRIAGIAFGHGDFSLAMCIKEAPSTAGIVLHARCQVPMAAKAAGITPIDNVFLHIPDIEGLIAETRQGKQLGYEGKACIHPNQIEPVNAVYTPTPEEVAYACDLVAAFDQAVAEGKGAVAFRGRMLDGPIADIERKVLERARRASHLL
jgi:hypothetical protein